MPLMVVSTPIGNLEEASPRMASVLSSADLILCEDTRHTRGLLAGLNIPSPKLVSCNAQNEGRRLTEIVGRLEIGETIALVSDAGAPGLSDPGGLVVEAAHRGGHPVHVVAGPSSIIEPKLIARPSSSMGLAMVGLPSTPICMRAAYRNPPNRLPSS